MRFTNPTLFRRAYRYIMPMERSAASCVIRWSGRPASLAAFRSARSSPRTESAILIRHMTYLPYCTLGSGIVRALSASR